MSFVTCFIIVFYVYLIYFHLIRQNGSLHVHVCRWIHQSTKIVQTVEISANGTHANTRLHIVDMLLTLIRVLIDVIRNQTAQDCRNM